MTADADAMGPATPDTDAEMREQVDRADRAAQRPRGRAAAKEPAAAAAPVAAKPEPCPCQAEGAVTLEDIDARIQAVGRLVLVVAVAAAVAYLFAGREQIAGGRDG